MELQKNALNIELRDYQLKAVDSIRKSLRAGSSRALVVASTGSGKTTIFSHFVKTMAEVSPRWTCLILVPKIKLVSQVKEEIQMASVFCGSLKQYDLTRITVATYQSLTQAIHAYKDYQFDTIILDEVHRYNPQEDSKQRRLIDHFSHSDTRIIGFTATPYRGATPLWLLGKYWDEPCFKIGIKELTAQGYLTPAKMIEGEYHFSTQELKVSKGEWDESQLTELSKDEIKMRLQIEDAIGHLNKHGKKKAVWICINQDHAAAVTTHLNSIQEKATLVISRDSMDERDESFEEFETGSARHLVSVQIASEGYNYVPTDSIIFLRPVRSVVTYIQAVGRALRPNTGKDFALVLDYGEVVRNCGKLDRPFVNTDKLQPRDSKVAREKLKEECGYLTIQCKGCGMFFFPAIEEPMVCPDCGALYEKEISKKLSSTAAMGSLYSEESIRHVVYGCKSISYDGINLYITLLVKDVSSVFQGTSGEHQITYYAPRNLRNPSKYELGRLRRTKSELTKFFGSDSSLSYMKMVERVLDQGAKFMPKIIEIADADSHLHGTQPFASLVDSTSVLQESLF